MKTFHKLIENLGYCCPTEFFLAHGHKGTKALAETLELSPRTIRLHKQIAQEESECPGYDTCSRRLHPHL
jgi:hypothetical protein